MKNVCSWVIWFLVAVALLSEAVVLALPVVAKVNGDVNEFSDLFGWRSVLTSVLATAALCWWFLLAPHYAPKSTKSTTCSHAFRGKDMCCSKCGCYLPETTWLS